MRSGAWKRGVFAAVTVVALVVSSACRSMLPRQYEYEEEIYLALDGTATVYVNSSVAALVALRGLPLDTGARSRLDRTAIRAMYTSPNTEVTRYSTSRRHGRRFVHLRISVHDIRKLGATGPFSWSTYSLTREQDAVVYRQTVGTPTHGDPGPVNWTGEEITAFRLHLPSKIRYHNAPSKMVERGNILSWEQPLTDRLAGKPIVIEIRLDTQSILYRTLWLFGLMIALVAMLFVAVIWWIVRAGRAQTDGRAETGPGGSAPLGGPSRPMNR